MKADKLLEKRKNRSVAIILRYKDDVIDPLLGQLGEEGLSASTRLRGMILDVFNDFCDMAKDIAMSGEAETMWFNDDLWEQRMKDMERRIVTAIRDESDGGG